MHIVDTAVDILIILLSVLTYYTSIFHTILLAKANKDSLKKDYTARQSAHRIIILIPCKKEPMQIIAESLKENISILKRYNTILVYILDEYTYEEVVKLVTSLRQYNMDTVDVVLFVSKSSKNKANALNKVLKTMRFTDEDIILVLDVDSHIVNIGDLSIEAASPKWIGYITIPWSKLGKGQLIGYEIYSKLLQGLYRLTGWVPTLGAGLAAKYSVLRRVSYFSEDVILEDVDFAMKLARAGIDIKYPYSEIKVQVPSVYTSLLRQQVRWAYGAGQLIRKYLRYIVRRPVIGLYLMQYLTYAGHLVLVFLIDIVAILKLMPSLYVQLFAYILFLYSSLLYPVYMYLEGKLTKDVLVNLNRVNMAFVLMSPWILYGFLLGLMNFPFKWIPTPKIEEARGLCFKECIVELVTCVIIAVLTIYACIISLCVRNLLLMLISISFSITYLWGLVRLLQSQLA